jgi:hypothetical protein
MTGLMIALELAERCLVELMQHFAQRCCFRVPGCKALPIYFSQSTHESVSMLVTDLTVPIAVSTIEAGLLHFRSPQEIMVVDQARLFWLPESLTTAEWLV